MSPKDKDLEKLEEMRTGDTVHINWHEESGGEVIMIHDVYVLFEVPCYGGVPKYEETFYAHEIHKLINLVYTWT